MIRRKGPAWQSVRDPGDTTTGVFVDETPADPPGRHTRRRGRHTRRPVISVGVGVVMVIVPIVTGAAFTLAIPDLRPADGPPTVARWRQPATSPSGPRHPMLLPTPTAPTTP